MLRNGEYCYFHRRWQMTSVDLSQSVHHVTPMFDLPVLEDADSIQITLGQIMRMIVCRQVDSKSAGLLLYALQIASANLRRTHFEPCFKQHVTVDLLRVPERILGDDAWSASDFKHTNRVARTPSPAEESCGGRASSPAEESCVARTLLSANESLPDKKSPVAELPTSPKETHVARTPSSANESLPEKKSPVAELPSSAHESSPTSSLPSDAHHLELQKAERAMTGALKGDWRDLKTLFEFTGVFPSKDDDVPTTDP